MSGFEFDPAKGYMPSSTQINDGAYYPPHTGISQVQTYYEATGFVDGDGNTPTGGLVQAIQNWADVHVVHWDAVNTPMAPSTLNLGSKTITGLTTSSDTDGAVTRGYVDTLVTTGGVDISTLGDPNDVITINPTETAFKGRNRSWLEHGLEDYNAAISYSVDDEVIRNNLYFRSLTSSNLNNDPLTSPDQWVIVFKKPGYPGEISFFHESLLTSLQSPISTGTSDITAETDITSSASSIHSFGTDIFPVSNLIDSNLTTVWGSQQPGDIIEQAVTLIYSSQRNFSKIELYPRTSYGSFNFKDFIIEVSSDTTDGNDGEWLTVNWGLTTLNTDGAWESFNVSNSKRSISAHAIRIRCHQIYVSLAEIRVYENNAFNHLIDSSNSFSSVSQGDLVKCSEGFARVESVSANDLTLSDDIIDYNSAVSYQIYKQILLDGWVRANGQILSNPLSPLNGTIVPNLNNDSSNALIGNGMLYLTGSIVAGKYIPYATGKHEHYGKTSESGRHGHTGTTSLDSHNHSTGFYSQNFNIGSNSTLTNHQNYPGSTGNVTTSSDQHDHSVTFTNQGEHIHPLVSGDLISSNPGEVPLVDSFTVVFIMKVEL